MKNNDKLIIAKLEEIVEFYGKCLTDNAMFLHLHHCGASQEDIKKGKRLRNELRVLKGETELE